MLHPYRGGVCPRELLTGFAASGLAQSYPGPLVGVNLWRVRLSAERQWTLMRESRSQYPLAVHHNATSFCWTVEHQFRFQPVVVRAWTFLGEKVNKLMRKGAFWMEGSCQNVRFDQCEV